LPALSLCTCCRHYPGAATGGTASLIHSVVSAFPGLAAGSARASTFSRFAQRLLALRPAHSRGHRIVARLPEGFNHFVSSIVASVLPAGAVRRVGLSPTGKRRLITAHVESKTGAVAIGVASLLPRLSVRGAPLATPWLRFQSPLIEPDRRISRIRLSDKASCFRPRKVACADDDGATAKCAYPAPALMARLATTQAARCRPAGSSNNSVRVLPSLPHGMRFATPETARVV